MQKTSIQRLRTDHLGSWARVSWQVVAVGADGKRGPAGLVIPDFLEDANLKQYLFDLFHESAAGGGDVVDLTSFRRAVAAFDPKQ